MSAVCVEPLINLRPMQLGDLTAVMDIEKVAYPFPWTFNIFRDCLQVGYRAWVLEQERQVIGYGLMIIAAGEAHVLNICVHPQRQQCGFGRYILEHLLAVARQGAVDTVFLEVRPSNQIAFNLYTRSGFNQVGIRRKYYPGVNGQREDALILAMTLLKDYHE